MESGVEGAFINLKQIMRTPVNPLGNGITVERTRFERFQDEHVQSAGNEITGVRFIEGLLSHKWLREVYLQYSPQSSRKYFCLSAAVAPPCHKARSRLALAKIAACPQKHLPRRPHRTISSN